MHHFTVGRINSVVICCPISVAAQTSKINSRGIFLQEVLGLNPGAASIFTTTFRYFGMSKFVHAKQKEKTILLYTQGDKVLVRFLYSFLSLACSDVLHT